MVIGAEASMLFGHSCLARSTEMKFALRTKRLHSTDAMQWFYVLYTIYVGDADACGCSLSHSTCDQCQDYNCRTLIYERDMHNIFLVYISCAYRQADMQIGE